jgi:hypothetical protein
MLWDALDRALEESEADIVSHIAAVEVEDKETGIEKQFVTAFEAKLPKGFCRKESSIDDFGGKQFFLGRKKAQVDCYIPELKMAIEFKAIRLPRIKHNELYYISQIAADILRLRSATKLKSALAVLFAYGPLVEGTTTKNQLYRAFHNNSLFVDTSIAKILRDDEDSGQHCRRARLFGWNKPWTERGCPPGVTVKRTKRIGAICIDCDPGSRIPAWCFPN